MRHECGSAAQAANPSLCQHASSSVNQSCPKWCSHPAISLTTATIPDSASGGQKRARLRAGADHSAHPLSRPLQAISRSQPPSQGPDLHPQASPRRPRRARVLMPLSARPSASPACTAVCARCGPGRSDLGPRGVHDCCSRKPKLRERAQKTDRRKPGRLSCRAHARARTQAKMRTRSSAPEGAWSQGSSSHARRRVDSQKSRRPFLGAAIQVSSSSQQAESYNNSGPEVTIGFVLTAFEPPEIARGLYHPKTACTLLAWAF